MPRNVEIKARVRDWKQQLQRARQLAGDDATLLQQRDTFFVAPHGRLKLREFPQGPCELIHYGRPDQAAAKTSEYTIYRGPDAELLLRVLGGALGIRGRVIKRRTLLLVGQTRVHFDEVENLGKFIELEVVLDENQPEEEGRAIAERLRIHLGIQNDDLLEGAYLDLLLAKAEP